MFLWIRQEPGEDIDACHTRLRQAASSCGFINLYRELKFHVIKTTSYSKLRKASQELYAHTIEAGRNNELDQAQNIEMEWDLTGVR